MTAHHGDSMTSPRYQDPRTPTMRRAVTIAVATTATPNAQIYRTALVGEHVRIAVDIRVKDGKTVGAAKRRHLEIRGRSEPRTCGDPHMRGSTRTYTTDPLRGPETGGSPVSGPEDVSVMTIWKDPAVFLRQAPRPGIHCSTAAYVWAKLRTSATAATQRDDGDRHMTAPPRRGSTRPDPTRPTVADISPAVDVSTPNMRGYTATTQNVEVPQIIKRTRSPARAGITHHCARRRRS